MLLPTIVEHFNSSTRFILSWTNKKSKFCPPQVFVKLHFQSHCFQRLWRNMWEYTQVLEILLGIQYASFPHFKQISQNKYNDNRQHLCTFSFWSDAYCIITLTNYYS